MGSGNIWHHIGRFNSNIKSRISICLITDNIQSTSKACNNVPLIVQQQCRIKRTRKINIQNKAQENCRERLYFVKEWEEDLRMWWNFLQTEVYFNVCKLFLLLHFELKTYNFQEKTVVWKTKQSSSNLMS